MKEFIHFNDSKCLISAGDKHNNELNVITSNN